MAENNKEKDNELDDTEDSEEEDIGVGNARQNKIIIIVVSVILVSASVYFFLLKEPAEMANTEQTNEIIISGGGVQPLTGEQVDYNVTDILDTLPDANFTIPNNTQDTIPVLPEIPELPDEIKQQIAQNIAGNTNNNIPLQPTIQQNTQETYTKEQVDKMIEDKIKEVMQQQNNQQNNQNEQNILTNNILPQNINQNTNQNTNNQENINDLLTDSNISSVASIQKTKVLNERMGRSIFSLSGGSGPANSMPQDSDAIILTYMDSKLDIPTKVPDIMPTQITDLTRTILQGKIINAALETAIDTDIPSDIRAVITRDVFAEEGKNILIPKGSRIIGTYSTNVNAGQTRVTINWNRIIRVDGMSLNIASIGADRLGRAGVQGEVDNKYAQRLANTFLSSILSVGTSLAVEKMSGSTGITSTVSSLTGETTTTSGKASDYALIDATQNLMDEAQNIVDNIASQKPVIRIPQGEKITIMVTQDVTLPVYKRGN